jgi:hypothetical protein
MASEVTEPGGRSSGWNVEFTLSDWLGILGFGKGDGVGTDEDKKRHELEDRLDSIGWGLVFLLIGALALPNGPIEYVSAAAVGAAMLGLNIVRLIESVPVRWFTVILGSVLLVGGTGALAGVHMDVFLLFFVVAGVVTIAGSLIQPRKATPR